MMSHTQAPKPLNGEEAHRIVERYRQAIEDKRGPVADVKTLPFDKPTVKLALEHLMSREEDLFRRSSLSLAYLALAEFQAPGVEGKSVPLKDLIHGESENLLSELRRMETH